MTRQLIWTRSKEDWAKDQKLWVGRGVEPLLVPCVSLTPIAEPDLTELKDLDRGRNWLWIFTSQAASSHFLGAKALRAHWHPGDAMVAIGYASAKPLIDAGFVVRWPEYPGTAQQLGQYIWMHYQKSPAICVGAVRRAFDLKAYLQRAGFDSRAIDLYATQSKVDLKEEEIFSLRSNLQGVLSFASPSAVRGFSTVFAGPERMLTQSLEVAVIGPTTYQAAAQIFANVLCAEEPTLSSLVNCAYKLWKK